MLCSGLICTPISPSIAENLDLSQMVEDNTESHGTAYTISVDASDPSITTGISAHDRALTCRTLALRGSEPSFFRRPGHVFPLRARAGGVKERTGHTEAAIDLCRLAGFRPAAVISEIVEDGGEVEGVAELKGSGMMRRDGCLRFGRKWGLKVCTIDDLVAYREVTERKENVNGGIH